MRCSECGAKISDTAKFCPESGAKVELEEEVYVCPECGKEVGKTAKFCEHCGAKLEIDEDDEEEYVEVCPDCGQELKPGAKFCPNCGAEFEDEDEDEDYEDEDDEEEIDLNDYEIEVDDELKAKMSKIVDRYIGRINDDGTAYTSRDVLNPDNEDIFDNVMSKITQDETKEDILGFIDITMFENGKGGLVFTTHAIYDKDGVGKATRVPYGAISTITVDDEDLIFDDTAFLNEDIDDQMFICTLYKADVLKTCIDELMDLLEEEFQ